jgi:hypothetical protein
VDGASTLRTDGGFVIIGVVVAGLSGGVGTSDGGWLTLVRSWVLSRST